MCSDCWGSVVEDAVVVVGGSVTVSVTVSGSNRILRW